ncbi:molybdopterin adenylyltransferase [Gracilimonas mengyeensis]|uniref:Molybdopterin adenylyltransferase n=1 Tax=Gracilimonas mengyeensis TaxID=1302730 RepID=A0A521BKU7_9BACT|nr:molybdopterin adenylyltransferase [Gracilimonas mengyeensis]SMO47719.1 molybdopterin adenylyltransferase [Gracilimonas mengyeensis]
MADLIRIGIITSSDRASEGVYDDRSGPAIKEYFSERLQNSLEWKYKVIPDEYEMLTKTMIDMCDEGCSLICTTGGTGPAKRDITPEATEYVCEKMLPGFGEVMRKESLQYVPTAILSRQTAGIRDNTLIINLPGKPKAIAECLDAVIDAIPYCIDLVGGPQLEFSSEFDPAFRPKK